jgi:hypothetical protein
MTFKLFTLTMKRKNFLITASALIIAFSSKSQGNVSYNVNSIPINGSFNVAVGIATLPESSGHNNVAIGSFAMQLKKTGYNNVAVGGGALISNANGNSNVAIGDSAGFYCLGSGNIFMGQSAGLMETGSNKFYLGNDASKTLIYGDFTGRQVLLGVANPTGYAFKGNRTLNVERGILTDSIRVSPVDQWADYVFDENYPLKPISELSEFIRTHKHLPNIPTTEEVNSHGIELGAMNARLLEKIEELTLYVIQLQDQINELKKQGNSGK